MGLCIMNFIRFFRSLRKGSLNWFCIKWKLVQKHRITSRATDGGAIVGTKNAAVTVGQEMYQ